MPPDKKDAPRPGGAPHTTANEQGEYTPGASATQDVASQSLADVFRQLCIPAAAPKAHAAGISLPLPPVVGTRLIPLIRLQIHTTVVAALTANPRETGEAMVEDCVLPEQVVGTPAFWIAATRIDVRYGERTGDRISAVLNPVFRRFGITNYIRLTPGFCLHAEDRARIERNRCGLLVAIDDRAGDGPEVFAPKTLAWALQDLASKTAGYLAVVTPAGDHEISAAPKSRRGAKPDRVMAVVVLAGNGSGESWLAHIARRSIAGGRNANR